MKSVLISIRPEWCEKILTGEKTVEVRKTRPRLKTPFKCYIYCTNSSDGKIHTMPGNSHQWINQKIIGEFTCDKMRFYTGKSWLVKEDIENATAGSCLTLEQIKEYAGWRKVKTFTERKDLYMWHISDLHIYPEPVKLKDFWGIKPCKKQHDCCACEKWDKEKMDCDEPLSITRPPQSWCYLEECL